jgi:hypothetical protein
VDLTRTQVPMVTGTVRDVDCDDLGEITPAR